MKKSASAGNSLPATRAFNFYPMGARRLLRERQGIFVGGHDDDLGVRHARQ